jgi:hypothetical protein
MTRPMLNGELVDLGPEVAYRPVTGGRRPQARPNLP